MMKFSDKYSRTMKILDVWFEYMSEEELKTCIECIARFENLKELKLGLDLQTTEPINESLALIGRKCIKLLKFNIRYNQKSILNFAKISEFKTIEKLKIELPFDSVVKGSVQCLKHCKQLIDITRQRE